MELEKEFMDSKWQDTCSYQFICLKVNVKLIRFQLKHDGLGKV